jgi:dimethylamine/trimethylamine dehydrogenase
MPRGQAAMRAVKAEGGWGVVCTEEVEIHHSTDLSPFFEGRLWDDADIPAYALIADSIHQHGTLAGIELTYNGHAASNLYSRTAALGPRSMSLTGASGYEPGQTRAATKDDFKSLRRWHRAAALRAKKAGFDIIYVYAGHGLALAFQLLSKHNDRPDEYGGSLENRVRLLRELLEDTREAVGDTCAVALRFAVDELLGDDGMTHNGEAREVVSMLAELPDLWDVNIAKWANDSATSRFAKQGYQEKYISFVKGLTTKPVVGVGRYTSPEAMLSLVQRGIVDFVGAARPSIADPFLPKKIQENRFEDIRECIGCNICVSGDERMVPIRCTQNPSMGEEWRRGWHPETIAPKKSDREILIVGGGPAGLEAARALGQRGYRVILTEAAREFGGRVHRESQLPGLSEWRRVVDWRLTQIEKLPNVFPYLGSPMSAADVLDAGARDVIIATGSTWRRDGIGRTRETRFLYNPRSEAERGKENGFLPVFTPDDVMAGKLPKGRVVLYDDDHYYMGGVLAELLAQNDCQVTLATPAPTISAWTEFTLERERIHARLLSLGVTLLPHHVLASSDPEAVTVQHAISSAETTLPADALVLVTERIPNDALYRELQPAFAEGRLDSLRLIGDAEAPNIIAQAVYSGHLAAQEFDETVNPDETPFLRERTL